MSDPRCSLLEHDIAPAFFWWAMSCSTATCSATWSGSAPKRPSPSCGSASRNTAWAGRAAWRRWRPPWAGKPRWRRSSATTSKAASCANCWRQSGVDTQCVLTVGRSLHDGQGTAARAGAAAISAPDDARGPGSRSADRSRPAPRRCWTASPGASTTSIWCLVSDYNKGVCKGEMIPRRGGDGPGGRRAGAGRSRQGRRLSPLRRLRLHHAEPGGSGRGRRQ